MADGLVPPMDALQRAVFERYVGLGDDRTLEGLFPAITQEHPTVTLRKVQRWSAKWNWPETARLVENRVVDEVVDAIRPTVRSMAYEQISTLQAVQQRFIERFGYNPEDPTLTPEQRLRVIDPDFRDFLDAIKTERLIMGDPTERKEVITNSVVQTMLTDEDLLEIAQKAARRRFGAVTGPIIDVTPEEQVERRD